MKIDAAMIESLLEALSDRVAAKVATKIAPLPTAPADYGTASESKLPDGTSARSFRAAAKQIAGARRAGRHVFVPRVAWDEFTRERAAVRRAPKSGPRLADEPTEAEVLALLAANGTRATK